MHNGPLSEKMKDSLRCHILEQMSLNVEDVDGNFLQQIRDKQDLWQCLQDFQNKLKTEWSTKVAGQHEIAKLPVKESTRDQSETDTLYDVEINDQLSFLTQQQKELLYRNYGIKNRQELMQLKLGDLHQIGIIQGDELAAIIHVALNANKRSSARPCLNNINQGHIMSTEVIEVDDDDDDDDYQTKLVIDETCSGDTITNVSILLNLYIENPLYYERFFSNLNSF